MKIKELSLYCSNIEEVSDFYVKNMGLKKDVINPNEIKIRLGESSLLLKEDSNVQSNFLAYSIQLPGNKIREAKNYYSKSANELNERIFSDFGGLRSVQAFGIRGPQNTHIELHAFPEIYNPSQEPFGNRHLLNIDSVVLPVILVQPIVELLEKTGELKWVIEQSEDACAIGTEKSYIHLMSFQQASKVFGVQINQSPNFGVKIETNDRILELLQLDNFLQINEL